MKLAFTHSDRVEAIQVNDRIPLLRATASVSAALTIVTAWIPTAAWPQNESCRYDRPPAEPEAIAQTRPSADFNLFGTSEYTDPGPDLSGIPGQATATLQVNPAAIARILGEAAAAGLAKAGTGAPAPKNLPLPPDKCPNCDAGLPPNRAISFCPACGRSVTAVPCDACGADMEPGWRFCVDCGHEAGETAPVQT